MFEIEISRTFSAAHQLRGYCGSCQNLHGHNYKLVVTVKSGTLDEIGISLDFKKLKAEVDAMLESFDHHFLNEMPEFRNANPTSENLAKTMYGILKTKLERDGIKLDRVRIYESENSSVSYYE